MSEELKIYQLNKAYAEDIKNLHRMKQGIELEKEKLTRPFVDPIVKGQVNT